MSDSDFSFVQKRFLEEFAEWAAVEQVELNNLLTEMPQPQLGSTPMGLPEGETAFKTG
jgi:hypothetical protein